MNRILIAIVCALLAGQSFSEEKLSLEKAMVLIQDSEAMKNDREKQKAVVDAFKGLPADQAQKATEDLLALMPKVGGHCINVINRIVPRLGDGAVTTIKKAIVTASDEDWNRKYLLAIVNRLSRKLLDPVTELLSHDDPRIRQRAAFLLTGMTGYPGRLAQFTSSKELAPAANSLAKCLSDDSTALAVQAAKTLVFFGVHGEPAIPALSRALLADDVNLRNESALALGAIGKNVATAVPPLMKALEDKDNDVRLQVARSLSKLGKPALDALVNTLKNGSPVQRRFAACSLAMMGTNAVPAVEALGNTVNDKDESIRVNAVDALGRIGGKPAITALVAKLSDKSVLVRYRAMSALKALAGDDAKVSKAIAKCRTRIAAKQKQQSFGQSKRLYKNLDDQIGGPLAGAELPLFATRHGEQPGYPGCLPDRQDPEDPNQQFMTQGMMPERQLYPDTVEHYRSYWFKYIPVHTFFDAQSQISNWAAKDIGGVDKKQVEQYAEPLYWVARHGGVVNTDVKNKPVPVIRCKPKKPVMELDLGTLPIGMYVVRVIGAVPTEQLQPCRKPLFLCMTVNDGSMGPTADRQDGSDSMYKLRLGYVDEFYSVAEFYFHAVTKRRFKARLWVDNGSKVDLLVHNITLDDVLAGVDRRPFKTRATSTTSAELAKLHEESINAFEARHKRKWAPTESFVCEEQWARDEVIWKMYPRLNVQPGANYGVTCGYQSGLLFGTGGETTGDMRVVQADSEKQWGLWTGKGHWPIYNGPPGMPLERLKKSLGLLSNSKLGVTYTMDDLAAHKPLPDPYPYKDDGTGLYFAPKDKDGGPQYFNVVADAVTYRLRDYSAQMNKFADVYHKFGDKTAGRDAAFMLIRATYDAPGIDPANAFSALLADPGPWGRDLRCRRRVTNTHPWMPPIALYDKLFNMIQGNEELAASISRFIPWVKNSTDLVVLMDSYLVQTYAKRVLRYQYMWDNAPTLILDTAIMVDDRELTNPWLEWLFSRAYIYPLPPLGLQDLLITANDRDGAGYIASYAYAGGEEASKHGETLGRYIDYGGNPAYDLRNPERFPKVISACYWTIRSVMAGHYFPRIGDVCGPDKFYGQFFSPLDRKIQRGWKWTGDPAFAWMIKHRAGRGTETDAEWAAIEKAATSVKRAPYLTQKSRIMANWFGLLETGIEHDDYRFRRNVMLRIGQGYGHQHNDTLDLQIHAHGFPMTIDGGQRPRYSRPADRKTYVHNLVQVDGKEWIGHSWIKTLSDSPGARYMQAEAVPPVDMANVKFRRRQVALIDVDAGKGSRPLTPEQLKPHAKLDTDIVTPNSYVFDVVRISGGSNHTYCFHATLEDEMQVNLLNRKEYADLPKHELGYLARFNHEKPRFGGDAQDIVQATWRMKRGGYEKCMCADTGWDEKMPRKYTRLHVLGHKDARVLCGWFNCHQWKYGWSQLFVQQRSDSERDIVFPAIIEPYAGEPFIKKTALLTVKDNESDANRAVAVQVTTVNGHTDLVFADGRPEKTRSVKCSVFSVQCSGEFAYMSQDAQGLRQATLTGGTLLDSDLVTLRPLKRERTGKVTKVDYAKKKMSIDTAWSEREGENVFEIGLGSHWTAYTATKVEPQAGGSVIALLKGADLYAGRVLKVNEEQRTIECVIGLPLLAGAACPGMTRNLVASNEARTKFWRAEYMPDTATRKYSFKLDGPVTESDFGKTRRFRLWEYGVGDNVRQSTHASISRAEKNLYELTADIDVAVGLKGAGIEWSTDKTKWSALQTRKADGKVEGNISLKMRGRAGIIYLRTK